MIANKGGYPMKVRELMTVDPAACTPKGNCAVAGKIMREHNCGIVPVVDNHQARKIVGVITGRDLALCLSQEPLPAAQVPVSACMTREVKTISPDLSVEEAVELMELAAIHRLPVAEDEKLVGILSLKDIALYAKQIQGSVDERTVERELAEIVEAIALAR